MSSEKRQKIVRYLSNLNFENIKIENDTFTYLPISSDEIFNEKFKLIFFFYKDKNELFEQHKDLWNENRLNFFIAVNDQKSYIIDVKQKPNTNQPLKNKIGKGFDYGINTEGFEKEKIQPLLKESIDNSYFWDYVIERRKTVNEVDDDLLNNLVALHKNLTEGNNNYEDINLLILQCLFVKYLEDRDIFEKESILIKALQHNDDKELKKVFERIKSINGDIFSNVEFTITFEQLEELSIFFKHDYRQHKYHDELYYESPYKFDKIPIELISNVYEEFLGKTNKIIKKSQGVFYTRSFVVDFILSHSVYKQVKNNKELTILDPACGSGIFLVQSYKAILKQNPNISIDDKVTILQKQIFGIDIDKRALQIAAFSLYLALLASCTKNKIKERIEKQKPMLPNLIGKNLLKKNTITDEIGFYLGKMKIDTFDCIVGNPPWGRVEEYIHSFNDNVEIFRNNNIPDSIIEKLNAQKIKTDKFEKNLQIILDIKEYKYIDKIIKYSEIETKEQFKERNRLNNKSDILYANVSHKQRSQCFLLRINQWCNENTAISFIVNNSNFLNNESNLFRRELLQKYNISNYYDLSNISDFLFKHTKEPSAILVMNKKKNIENDIIYCTAQLTDIAKTFRLIHYSSNDVKKVKQNDLLLEGQDIIWKIFVNGNWDDYQLLKKKELLKSNDFNLICQRGFQLHDYEKKKPDKLAPLKHSDYEQFYTNYPNHKKFDWERGFFRLPLPKSFSPKIFNENILSSLNNEDKDYLNKYYKYSNKFNRFKVLRNISNKDRLRINHLLASIKFSLFTGNKILISRTHLDDKKMKCVFTSEEIPFDDKIICVKSENIENYYPLLAILNSSFIGYYMHYFSLSEFRLSTNVIEKFPIPKLDNKDLKVLKLIELVQQIQIAKKRTSSNENLEEQIDELVFDLYGLLDFEKEIIREFYDVNVNRKSEKENKTTKEDLQKYVDKFRDVFSFILDEKLALNAEYFIQNIGTIVSFSIVSKDKFSEKIQKSKLNILNIVKRSQLKESYLSKAIKEEKVKVYTEENFNIIKSKYFKDWTIRQALKDANEEIGLIVQRLPKE